MKIGISTVMHDRAYGRFGAEQYEKIREHGFSCIDLNLANTNAPVYQLSEKESDEILAEERKRIETAGLEISQVHGPWRWPPRDFSEEDREERMEKMKKAVRMCSVLGCENLVVHPIMPYGTDDAGTDDESKTWNLNVEFMNELLKAAKQRHVTICLENMPMIHFSLAKPEQILNFVRFIDDENFKICLDTGHVSVFDSLSAGESVRQLSEYIRVFHIHDNMYGLDLHLPPRFGTIDWKDFAAALKEIHFEGSFSLETAPPSSLPDDIFEQMCVSYVNIAKDIINEGRR